MGGGKFPTNLSETKGQERKSKTIDKTKHFMIRSMM